MDHRKDIAPEIPRLRRYARALYSGDVAAADDLVQDAVERALSRLHLFRSGSSMRAWLLTITRNVYVNQMRSLSRRPQVRELDQEQDAALSTQATQNDGLVVRDLSRALSLLPEDQREVVLLVGLEDLSYKETADVLGVAVGTVMSRLSRGRTQLRRLMEGAPVPRKDHTHLRSVK
ncbi:MAG: RNA polymerase sigma factor [Magnetovibrio sp.]|nr:RNA polymerase sigma factor [Magnetovibrio sp.]